MFQERKSRHISRQKKKKKAKFQAFKQLIPHTPIGNRDNSKHKKLD